MIAENILMSTPIANVIANPFTIDAPNVSANQNNTPHVINVDILLSRIADHALLNPILIAAGTVLP